ncbi:hypothetical protein BSR09_18535 [Stutzerimonas degradans]|nr:hypothetical protein BSR09_18535 [Stutzerimonas degradans]
MNIIYLHQYFTTPENFGGVRSYQFAKRLVEEGHQVDLITSSAFFPIPQKSRLQWVSRQEVDGIKIHVIHVPYNNKMSFFRRIYAFILFMLVSSFYSLTLPRCNLLYASSTPLTIAIPALIYCKIKRVPLVFEVRDLWPDIPVTLGILRSKVLINILYRFENHIYRVSKKVVVLSTGMLDELLKKGVPQNKIVVVPNACDIQEFTTGIGADDNLGVLRGESNSRICIYAGTFGYVNNLEYLINLAEQIEKLKGNVKFLLIGDGAEKLKLQNLVRDKGLDHYVLFMPSMSKARLISFLKAADACLSIVRDVPILYNNSANKFFDSLAAGRPIIINYGGWQAEVIEENKIGLVLGMDSKESARKLISFLGQIEAVSAERILAVARENYSRDGLFERLCNEALYPSALIEL